MSYYSDDDEIDIHVRRGRASPVYDRPRHRPQYYARGDTRLEISDRRYERSRSRGHYIVRERSVERSRDRSRDRSRERSRERRRERERDRPATPQPIIINNKIENRQDDDDYDDRDRFLPIAVPVRTRSRSRHRDTPPRDPGYMSREDYELERTRKELENYKLEKKREEEEKLIKKDIELKRLREEKKAEEDKKKKKEEEDRLIKEWKAREAEKKERERKEKEEREAEYKKRLEEDLRKSGMDDRQIAIVLKKEKDGKDDPSRPTYTRMARRYLSIETLRELRIDYTLDTDPDFILIKRWVPEYEQDFLWNHTRELREIRERPHQPIVLAIEEKKHKHHNHKDDEFEIVRKHKRKTSPSPLITFFAGGKR